MALLAILALGCGEGFDEAYELQSLRVLAVQKQPAYAAPGETVDLRMLWHDARDGSSPTLVAGDDIHWFAGCLNPVGGSYSACLANPGLMQAFASLTVDSARPPEIPLRYGRGERFTMQVPVDGAVLPPRDPFQPAYGSAFVFFAVCAGELEVDPDYWDIVLELVSHVLDQCAEPECVQSIEAACPTGGCQFEALVCLADPARQACAQQALRETRVAQDLISYQAFPLLCRDPGTGRYRGSQDYVAGYSQIFVYAEDSGVQNQNPEITGFVFNRARTPECSRCIGEACLDGWRDSCADDELPRVPPCADDGGVDCAEYNARPEVDESIAEPDTALGGRSSEQMWINYYVDRGGVSSALRLLNESEVGWNAEYRTKYRAPADAGRVNLWAAVHDNRGGVEWVRQTILVGEPD